MRGCRETPGESIGDQLQIGGGSMGRDCGIDRVTGVNWESIDHQ